MKDKVMGLACGGSRFFNVRFGPIQRGSGLDLTLEYPAVVEARSAFDGLAAGGKVIMPLSGDSGERCSAVWRSRLAFAGK